MTDSHSRRTAMRRVALALAAGVMLGFSFPPSSLGILACFGIVPLLFLLSELSGIRSALRYSYLTFLVFHVITVSWTGGYSHGNDPYMMIAGAVTMLVHPLFYWIPIGVFAAVRNRLGENQALAAFPMIWVAYEYSHSLSEWSFPWLTLGNSQSYDLARIQFISATGVLGLSFWILLVNVCAYLLLRTLLKDRLRLLSRTAVRYGVALLLLYALPSIYGAWVLRGGGENSPGLSRDSISIGIIQANVDPWEKWKGGYETVDQYLRLTSQLFDSARTKKPQLVLWPETAFPFDLLADQNRSLLSDIDRKLAVWGTTLVTGLPHRVWYLDSTLAPGSARREKTTNRRYDWFNASTFVQPGEQHPPWYGKMKLVPFAERIPYAEVFHFVDFLRWDVGVGAWQIGTDTTVFQHRASGAQFCTLICYESTYPDFVANFVRKGAEFIAIITIDSWWGRMPGAFQHQRFAVFRAVENRRWIARCAVGGISCFIDPFGRVYDQTELFTQTTLERTIAREHDLTLYTRYGDWLGKFSLLVAFLFLAAVAGQKYLHHARNHSGVMQ